MECDRYLKAVYITMYDYNCSIIIIILFFFIIKTGNCETSTSDSYSDFQSHEDSPNHGSVHAPFGEPPR